MSTAPRPGQTDAGLLRASQLQRVVEPLLSVLPSSGPAFFKPLKDSAYRGAALRRQVAPPGTAARGADLRVAVIEPVVRAVGVGAGETSGGPERVSGEVRTSAEAGRQEQAGGAGEQHRADLEPDDGCTCSCQAGQDCESDQGSRSDPVRPFGGRRTIRDDRDRIKITKRRRRRPVFDWRVTYGNVSVGYDYG